MDNYGNIGDSKKKILNKYIKKISNIAKTKHMLNISYRKDGKSCKAPVIAYVTESVTGK